MDKYNPVFGIRWPTPGAFGIVAVLFIILLVIIIYFTYAYFERKHMDRIHAYQHFLFQAMRKGLNNFQFKILKNMSLYLKLKNPAEIISNPSLYESALADFIEYLKKGSEGADNIIDIFRDLALIYEKLYNSELKSEHFESMSDIEAGEMIFFNTQDDKIFLGKVYGKGGDFLSVRLFTSDKNLKMFENETRITVHIFRVSDAEYIIHTATSGIEGDLLRIRITGDIVIGKEFRHPFIDTDIPSEINTVTHDESENEKIIPCSIVKINQQECVVRIPEALIYDRVYSISFEINSFRYNVISRVMSIRTVETDNIYYVTLKFTDISEPGLMILSKYMSGSI